MDTQSPPSPDNNNPPAVQPPSAPSDNPSNDIPAANPPVINPPPSETPPSPNPILNTKYLILNTKYLILYAVIIIIAFIASILFFSPPSFTAKLLNTGNRLSLKLPQIKFLQKLVPFPAIQNPSITPAPSIPSINFSALMTPASQSASPAKRDLAPRDSLSPTPSNLPASSAGGQPTIYNLRVPEPNEKLDDPAIAIPNSAISNRNSSIKTRSFEITAQKNTFIPSKIIVYKDDIVRIRFTPIDGNFDLTVQGFGVKKDVKMAETVVLEFQADSAGAFTFLCEGCGMKGDKPAVSGTLFVVPRP